LLGHADLICTNDLLSSVVGVATCDLADRSKVPLMVEAIMAKKKPGPKPSDGVGRTAATTIRSTPEWKGWTERLAEHCRANVSDTVDRGLVELARSTGFKDAPPKR
jgi:hypothetical protein